MKAANQCRQSGVRLILYYAPMLISGGRINETVSYAEKLIRYSKKALILLHRHRSRELIGKRCIANVFRSWKNITAMARLHGSAIMLFLGLIAEYLGLYFARIGLSNVKLRYGIFCPPVFSRNRVIEPNLSRLLSGAQFYTNSQKPDRA